MTERFQNPFIDHALLSIALNSTSKWKARVMPSLKGYVEKFGSLPKCISTSLAFYIAFYTGDHMSEEGLVGKRGTEEYVIKDDADVLAFYDAHKEDDAAALAHAVLSNTAFWGEDLTQMAGLEKEVADALAAIKEKGAYEVMKDCLA